MQRQLNYIKRGRRTLQIGKIDKEQILQQSQQTYDHVMDALIKQKQHLDVILNKYSGGQQKWYQKSQRTKSKKKKKSKQKQLMQYKVDIPYVQKQSIRTIQQLKNKLPYLLNKDRQVFINNYKHKRKLVQNKYPHLIDIYGIRDYSITETQRQNKKKKPRRRKKSIQLTPLQNQRSFDLHLQQIQKYQQPIMPDQIYSPQLDMHSYFTDFNNTLNQQLKQEFNYLRFTRQQSLVQFSKGLMLLIEKHDLQILKLKRSAQYLKVFDQQFLTVNKMLYG